MRTRGSGWRGIICGLILSAGLASANSLLLNVQFASGARGTVDLGAGDLGAGATSLLMMTSPDGSISSHELASAAVYQNVVLQNGALRFSPLWKGTSITPDQYAQMAQMALSALPAESFHSGQYVVGTLNSSVLGVTAEPLVGITFAHPDRSPSRRIGNEVQQEHNGVVRITDTFANSPFPQFQGIETPEPSTVALFALGLALLAIRKRIPGLKRLRG